MGIALAERFLESLQVYQLLLTLKLASQCSSWQLLKKLLFLQHMFFEVGHTLLAAWIQPQSDDRTILAMQRELQSVHQSSLYLQSCLTTSMSSESCKITEKGMNDFPRASDQIFQMCSPQPQDQLIRKDVPPQSIVQPNRNNECLFTGKSCRLVSYEALNRFSIEYKNPKVT